MKLDTSIDTFKEIENCKRQPADGFTKIKLKLLAHLLCAQLELEARKEKKRI